MDEKGSRGGVGLTEAMMAASLGAGGYFSWKRIRADAGLKQFWQEATKTAGNIKDLSRNENALRVLENLVSESTRTNVTQEQMSKALEDIQDLLRNAGARGEANPFQIKKAVQTAWESALVSAGPTYRAEAAKVGTIGSHGQFFNALNKFALPRANMPETSRLVSIFRRNLGKLLKGNFGEELVPGAGAFDTAATELKKADYLFKLRGHGQAAELLQNIQTQLGGRMSVMGMSEASRGLGQNLHLQFMGHHSLNLQVPLAFSGPLGGAKGLVSIGPAATRYGAGLFQIGAGPRMSYTEFYLKGMSEWLVPRLRGVADTREASGLLKQFQHMMGEYHGEYLPGIRPQAMLPHEKLYQHRAANLLTRLEGSFATGLKPAEMAELGEGLSYGGVFTHTHQGRAALEDLGKYVSFGETPGAWSVEKRIETMVRPYGMDPGTVEEIRGLGGMPRLAYTPRAYREIGAEAEPLVSTVFFKADRLKRTQRWFAEGAGFTRLNATTQLLMERVGLKPVTLLAEDVKIHAALAGIGNRKYWKEGLGISGELGTEYGGSGIFSLPEGAKIIEAARVPQQTGKPGNYIQTIRAFYREKMLPGKERTLKMWPKEVTELIGNKDFGGKLYSIAEDLAAGDPQKARAIYRNLAKAERATAEGMKFIEKVPAVQQLQMMTGMQEWERTSVIREQASAAKLNIMNEGKQAARAAYESFFSQAKIGPLRKIRQEQRADYERRLRESRNIVMDMYKSDPRRDALANVPKSWEDFVPGTTRTRRRNAKDISRAIEGAIKKEAEDQLYWDGALVDRFRAQQEALRKSRDVFRDLRREAKVVYKGVMSTYAEKARTIERQIISEGLSGKEVDVAYARLFEEVENAGQQNVARQLMQRAAQRGITPEEFGPVFGGLSYHMTPEQLTTMVTEAGLGPAHAQAAMETPYLKGYLRFSSKGPLSELGHGGAASIEPRLLMVGSSGGPAEQAAMQEMLQAREMYDAMRGIRPAEAASDLRESISTLLGNQGTRDAPRIGLEELGKGRARDIQAILERNQQGFYISMPNPITFSTEEGTRAVRELFIPGKEAMGNMFKTIDRMGAEPLPGYMTQTYADVLGVLRQRMSQGEEALSSTKAGEQLLDILNRQGGAGKTPGLLRTLFSTVGGTGGGSGVRGLERGKIAMSGYLTATQGVGSSMALEAGQVAISTAKAEEMLEEISMIRGAEEAATVRKAMFGKEGWEAAIWRHPSIYGGSLRLTKVRVDEALHRHEMQITQELWQVTSNQMNSKFGVRGKIDLGPMLTMRGDWDADAINVFMLSESSAQLARKQGAFITPTMQTELALRQHAVSAALKATGGGIDVNLAEMTQARKEYLQAIKGNIQQSMTGRLSIPLTKMRAGLRASGLEGSKLLDLFQLAGEIEEIPISSKHYQLSQMSVAKQQAEQMAMTMEKMISGGTQKERYAAVQNLEGQIRAATKGGGSWLWEGGTAEVELERAEKAAGEIKRASVKGWNLRQDLQQLSDITHQFLTSPATPGGVTREQLLTQALGYRGKSLSPNQIQEILGGQATKALGDISPRAPLIGGAPAGKGAFAGVVEKVGSHIRGIGQMGGRLIEHSIPLAYGLGGALAIGAFFSTPEPSIPAGAARPQSVHLPKRSGSEASLGPGGRFGNAVHGEPTGPAGISESRKTYIQRTQRFAESNWNAEVNIRGDVDATALASEIANVTRNQARVNINVRDERHKITSRKARDLISGDY